MRLTIDTLDGKGPIDYSDALAPEGPLTIDRRLNEPSVSTWTLALSAQPAPLRLGRAVVTRVDGTVVFTGYLTREPQAEFAGEDSGGPVFRLRCSATSDEWLLDKQGVSVGAVGLALTVAALPATLAGRVDVSRFAASGGGAALLSASSSGRPAKTWSARAGAVADAAYASYRVLSGQVTLQPIGAVTHTLAVTDGSLNPGGLQLAAEKELANDVLVSGALEPAAYVTEVFAGDGSTEVFQLSGRPFGGGASGQPVLTDSFNLAGGATGIDAQLWNVNDAGGHLSLGAGGLMLGGGNGSDGATTLTAVAALELGGTLVLEAGTVTRGQGSDGVLLGLYTGKTARAACLAGFDVRQSNGATTLSALIQGAATGTPLPLANGHSYTLRVRLRSPEIQRLRQTYAVMVDGVVRTFGGDTVAAPLNVVLEVVDQDASSNTPATVLFDGSVTDAPASATFVAVNSVQLLGAIGYVRVLETGSAWVASTVSGDAPRTRLLGAAGEGADCSLSSAGELRFFSGRVPVAGEQVTVTYRLSQRACARVQSAAGIAAESSGGLPGLAQWSGSITSPTTGSSEDCLNAAGAVLAIAGSRAEALAGSYAGDDLPDIWPGDLLALGEGSPLGATIQVRRAVLTDACSLPELVHWKLELANDWAECRSVRLGSTLAADVVLPQPLSSPVAVAGLGSLSVVNVTASAIQLDAGVAAPSGGGFEVRRRDGAFGPGIDQDLVLRSVTRGFSIPRAGQVEQYFVRMYDGSTPPVYSRLSSAVFTDIPVS